MERDHQDVESGGGERYSAIDQTASEQNGAVPLCGIGMRDIDG